MKLGRPKGRKTGEAKGTERKRSQFGLYPEDLAKIKEIAKKRRWSYSEVVRLAINDFYNNLLK